MAQSLSNLPIGAKIKFGKHSVNGETAQPIIWLVVSKNTGATTSGRPQNSITLLTERAIDFRCFDAIEPTNPNFSSGGFAKYSVSNIRQWMNSSATAGNWYSAQHSYDYPPSTYTDSRGETIDTTWFSTPYLNRPGFLYHFTESERNAIVNTSIDESFVSGGGTQNTTLTNQKLFLPAITDITTNWEYFTKGGTLNCYPTAQAVDNSGVWTTHSPHNTVNWWTRTQSYSAWGVVHIIDISGQVNSSGGDVYRGNYGFRPAMNLSTTLSISDTTDSDGCYTAVWNSAPPAPTTLTVPTVYGGKSTTISWSKVTDPDGNTVTYQLEQSIGGGAFTTLYSGANLSYSTIVPYGTTSVQFRVKATDSVGASSGYKTSSSITVINNNAPVISGTDSNLGGKTTAFSQTYSVTDANSNTVTITESIDGVSVRSYTATLGATNTFSVSGNTWLKLANGIHTLTIIATDGIDTSVRTYTFTKVVTSFTVQKSTAIEASAKPTRIKVSVVKTIPPEATFKVEVCNNGFDNSPTWEDATSVVLSELVYEFKNTTKTATKWGVNIRVTVNRNNGNGACYITSIGGNWE